MEYLPGDLVVAVGLSGSVVLAVSDQPETLIGALWQAVQKPLGADKMLGVLVGRDRVIDLTSIPDVAMLHRDSSATRVLVRGRLVAVVQEGRSERRLDGASLATWREETLSGAGFVTVMLDHIGDLGSRGWLPLQAGVVRAAGIRCALTLVCDEASGPADPAEEATDRDPETKEPMSRRTAVPEHSISYRLLFGPAAPSAPSPAAGGSPVVASRGGFVPAAGPPGEATLPPPADPVPAADVTENAPGRESRDQAPPDAGVVDDQRPPSPVHPSGAGASPAGMLPRMPSGWVRKRMPRSASAPIPVVDPGAAVSLPAVSMGRPAGFLARIRDADASPDASSAGSGVTRSPAPDTPRTGLPVVPPHLGPDATRLSSRSSTGPGSLLAAQCSSGHLTPPGGSPCRVCGMPVTDRSPTLVVRPELGRLCGPGIPDVPVSGPILIGRRPEWHEPGERPRLIILSDPEQNISRSHLAISVSGWDISVTDLGGPNGTRLRLPSGESRALVPHRPAALVPSTAITLADAVTIWFEVP